MVDSYGYGMDLRVGWGTEHLHGANKMWEQYMVVALEVLARYPAVPRIVIITTKTKAENCNHYDKDESQEL